MIRILKTTILMFTAIALTNVSSGMNEMPEETYKIPVFEILNLNTESLESKHVEETSEPGQHKMKNTAQTTNNPNVSSYNNPSDCSKAIRASLQNGNGVKEVVENAVASKMSPAEYCVRLAIEMILESFRLSEMAKNPKNTNNKANATNALNAGQEMFVGFIQKIQPPLVHHVK